MSVNIRQLNEIAHRVRVLIAKMYFRAGWGHFAPALSCVDILIAICFGMTGEKRYLDLDKDHLVLSKGHGCAALYATFAELGIINRDELGTFYQDGSRLIGLSSHLIPHIEIPTGALGHGICFGTGTALAAKVDGLNSRTFVIMGDGESQEGSVWEAAEFASMNKLNNLIVFLDRNGLQASDYVDSIVGIDPVKYRWESFGWFVVEVDGHSFDELCSCLDQAINIDKPTLIIAKTIKGKGISIAENSPVWHSRAPKGDEWVSVCDDLGIDFEELNVI